MSFLPWETIGKSCRLCPSTCGRTPVPRRAVPGDAASTDVHCCWGPMLQVSGEKEFFANLVVDAVSVLDPQTLDLRMIGIKKVTGSHEADLLRSLQDTTCLVGQVEPMQMLQRLHDAQHSRLAVRVASLASLCWCERLRLQLQSLQIRM